MLLSVCFCVMIAATYSVQQCLGNLSTEKETPYSKTELIGFYSRQREKRALGTLFGRGLFALTTLLKGATSVGQNLDSTGLNYRRYEKIGSYKTALRIFISLKPKNIRRLETDPGAYIGQVGDRKLVVRRFGEDYTPEIRISKDKEPNYVDIFTFKSKPTDKSVDTR